MAGNVKSVYFARIFISLRALFWGSLQFNVLPLIYSSINGLMRCDLLFHKSLTSLPSLGYYILVVVS